MGFWRFLLFRLSRSVGRPSAATLGLGWIFLSYFVFSYCFFDLATGGLSALANPWGLDSTLKAGPVLLLGLGSMAWK